MDLEMRILVTSMISGMLICFSAALGNFLLHLGTITLIVPFLMGISYLYFLNKVFKDRHYEFAAYASFLFLTFIVFPVLWFFNGGLSSSIPYFYIFMTLLTAVILNKFRYKLMLCLQLCVVLALILIEFNYPNLIVGYSSKHSQIIDMGSSLFILILLIFFMILYIMKEYHRMITQLELTQVELKEVNVTLRHASITDELTGLYNRRYIMNLIESNLNSDSSAIKAVIMIDIDFFKSINDQFGHSTGDFVLKHLGQLFTDVFSSNPIARIGGEEFLAVVSSEDATLLTEHLREAIECTKWDNPKLKVTISAGVYDLMPNENLERLLERVDAALYKAKSRGRNQVHTYTES